MKLSVGWTTINGHYIIGGFRGSVGQGEGVILKFRMTTGVKGRFSGDWVSFEL